jgi:hypothetical protein
VVLDKEIENRRARDAKQTFFQCRAKKISRLAFCFKPAILFQWKLLRNLARESQNKMTCTEIVQSGEQR